MSLFVFDEIDKIPIGLMDTIKPYIDFNNELDGIDYRPSVFIFLRYFIFSLKLCKIILNINVFSFHFKCKKQ